MATPFFRRRLRGHFGISAPRMTVTSSPPWWVRGAAFAILLVAIGGVAWWSFDFGQPGRVIRDAADTRITAVETEAARLRGDASALRTRNSELESDLAMSRGAEQALSRQVADLAAENAQLREEAAVLKRLVTDTGKPPGARKTR